MASNTTTKAGGTPKVTTSKAIEAAEQKIGQAGVVTFDDNNEQQVEDSTIEIHADMVGFDEKAARLAFLEEPVTIQIHEDNSNDNPEPYVFLQVNGEGPGPGRLPWVPRGVPVTMKRKFVERLARAKNETVRSIEKVGETGERYIEYPKHAALKYPFAVIEDRNPRGASWLRQVLTEG